MADEKKNQEPIVSQLKDNGDILQKMAAENAKTSDVVALLSGATQTIDNIANMNDQIHRVLQRQEDLLKSIFNLLTLWGRQGGISDPLKAGPWNYDNPLGVGNNSLVGAVTEVQKSASNLVQTNREAIQQQTRLQESQAKAQGSMEEMSAEMRQFRAALGVRESLSEESLRRELMRFRERNAPSDMYLQHTQSIWDDVVLKFNESISKNESKQLSAAQTFEDAVKEFHIQNNAATKQLYEDIQSELLDKLIAKYNLTGLSHSDIATLYNTEENSLPSAWRQLFDADDQKATEVFREFQSDFEDIGKQMAQQISDATGELVRPIGDFSDAADQFHVVSSLLSSLGSSSGLSGILGTSGRSGAGSELAGELTGSLVSEAIGPELGAALGSALGPAGTVAGMAAGEIVGKKIGEVAENSVKALGDLIETLETNSIKLRDKVVSAGFEKIRQDVQAMSTYQLDVYQKATQEIYSAWDKNLGQVTATQNYTKEQLNTLQDSVAQKLEALGFQNAINAADFTDSLVSALNANLSGELAEVFATESMILQKAIPEFNPASMAEQFAAVWTNAVKEGGSGQEAMVTAMEQIAGATRAIRESTEGNNQFVRQIPAYFTQAQEMVARAGGSVDQVAQLTTQMMAAEGPLAALTPQLSGFTGELIKILSDQNNASAVALRAIMHDINSDVGVSATDFMRSFMSDTQGTLVTAFDAIQQFMDRNMNAGAQQEFYDAMSTMFGISSEKLAQIDFGYISDEIAKTNASLNTAALLDAESLVKSGETETLEEQLVNNTSNMLLAQNAVRDTLDNALMRKLESNEINMERLIYSSTQTQAVDLAEATLSFFTKIKDAIMTLMDPLGIAKITETLSGASAMAVADAVAYQQTVTMSQIGSSVASDIAGSTTSAINTIGGELAAITAAKVSNGNAEIIQDAISQFGLSGTYTDMLNQYEAARSSADMSALGDQLSAAIARSAAEKERESEQEARDRQEAEYQKQLAEAQQAAYQQAVAEQEAIQLNRENVANINTTVSTAWETAGPQIDSISQALANIDVTTQDIDDWANNWFKEQVELYWEPVQLAAEAVSKHWDWFHTAHLPFINTTNSNLSNLTAGQRDTLTEVRNVKTSIENIKSSSSQDNQLLFQKLDNLTTSMSAFTVSIDDSSGNRAVKLQEGIDRLRELTDTIEQGNQKSFGAVNNINFLTATYVSGFETFSKNTVDDLQSIRITQSDATSYLSKLQTKVNVFAENTFNKVSGILNAMQGQNSVITYLSALQSNSSDMIGPIRKLGTLIDDSDRFNQIPNAIASAASSVVNAIRESKPELDMGGTESRLDAIYKAISTLVEMQWSSPANRAMLGGGYTGFTPEFQKIIDAGEAPYVF